MMARETWNRCDQCGQYIALADFGNGAVRRLIFPDSEYTRETYETLCRKHAHVRSAAKDACRL